ncbi:MAG: helix-turn-helix domain-containing protein [Oscillospiraceae bacterium]|jgi:transcriptional regulator with XRE-family HTH domain|nr:helix-turn-helix domain-containing protein [Oscillospiraceae bacterium]
MNFGERLRALIEERGITQKALAEQLNIAASTVSSYVQNTREPDFETLKRLARYFEVTPDYLLAFHTDRTTNPLENELKRVFGSMTKEQQRVYIEQGKVFVKSNHHKSRF